MTMFTTSWRVALAGALLAGAALTLPVGSLGATTASAPKPPSVYTGGVAAVSTTSATLKGGVTPHGLETSYVFQYGPTTAYGAQTSAVPVGSGTAAVQASQAIAGLQPGTSYHYRIVATSASGSTDGLDAAFTTKKIPLTFKIASTPNPDVFGMSFSVSGVLSGTEAANHEVVLQATPFPYLRGFKDTGNPVVTNASGNFTFPVANLLENTQFRVATLAMAGVPAVNSHPIIERVAVRVSLHVSSTGRPGFVRLYGSVKPSEVGTHVGFQLLQPGLRPLYVSGTRVRRATTSTSRFSRVVRIRRGGLYRAIVRVDNGKQVSGHSRAILIH
jgi:hypothetical protein